MNIRIRKFQVLVKKYYRAHGRHDLPFRRTRNPYHILVSEVMLQQTQVSRVAEFYPRFLKKFPTVRALVRAPLRDVLAAEINYARTRSFWPRRSACPAHVARVCTQPNFCIDENLRDKLARF